MMILAVLLIGLHTSWWVSLGVLFLIVGKDFEKNAGQLEINRMVGKLTTTKEQRTFWKSTSLAVWLVLVGLILAIVYHIGTMLL